MLNLKTSPSTVAEPSVDMSSTHYKYKAGEFQSLLDSLEISRSSGALHIKSSIHAGQKIRSRVLIWNDGGIIYGGMGIPDALTFVKTILQKFKPEWANMALKLTAKNNNAQDSVQELINLMIKYRVLTWQQAKKFEYEHIVLTLEQIISHPGQATFDPTVSSFDVCYEEGSCGFNLKELLHTIEERQRQWQALAPAIPSMEIIPYIAPLGDIPDLAVKQHTEKWFDGKRSLVDIATGIDRDPLQLAQLYRNWGQKGWVKFIDSEALKSHQLPVILSVDDSAIIQTMIKRALSSEFEVLLANKAVDAINLLTQQGDRISLLILDLTMPDMDGLELCRTIRNTKRFKHLPIIMLTARDGFVDKLKGQMAGSDRYLTKPFEAEKLLKIVQEYVREPTP